MPGIDGLPCFCVLVLVWQVKQVVDPDAADQLGTAIEFIKQVMCLVVITCI